MVVGQRIRLGVHAQIQSIVFKAWKNAPENASVPLQQMVATIVLVLQRR